MKHNTRLKIIKIVLALAVVILLFVPASVNHPQIDMRALVVAIGLDNAEEGEGIKATVEIILPVEGGGSVGSSEVIGAEGRTLAEALDNIGISLGRKPELNHCGIVVIGKDYAEKGITGEMEYLLSSGIVCPEINLTVAGNENAAEFLNVLSDYGNKLDLSNLLRSADLGVQNYSAGLAHFLKDLSLKSGAAAVPCIKMGYEGKKKEEGNKSGEGDKQSKESPENAEGGEESGKEGGGDKKKPIIENAKKTAVFKEGKLIDVYDETETFGLAWLDKKTKQGYVFVDKIEVNGKSAENIPLKIRKKSLKIKSRIEAGGAVYTVKLTVKLELEDKHTLNRFNINGKFLPKEAEAALKQKAEEIIADSLYKIIEKAKQDRVDILHAEDTFYRNNYKKYKELSQKGFDFLNDTKTEIQCKIIIN